MVMVVALGRAPGLGCTQCAPVAASSPQVLRDLGGLHTARSRQVGGFPSLRCNLVLWSKEIQWRWQPVVAASVAGGRSVAVSEMRTRPFRILISTGDVMGDMHGAALVRALIDAAGEEKVEIEVYAMGGKRMKDEGAVLIGDNTGLSSIGLLEALPLVIPSIQIQIRTRKFLKSHPPDLVVLIDYPGINIPFGKYAKKHFGCRVVYYIPPNEWLWNTSRTGAIIDSCDAILSVYPAETAYFRKSGGLVIEVGHPLLDRYNPTQTRTQAREALGYGEKDIVILLMPASRAQELRHVWPIIASAARLLLTRILALGNHHHVHFVVPSVLPSGDHIIKQSFEDFDLTGYASVRNGETQSLMAAADLAITKSGSVNLELALHNVPQVVVYKLDKATAWIARNVFQFAVQYISLVNLILEEQMVPEFIQDDAEPANVANAAFDLLPVSGSGHRNTLLNGYSRLLPLLGKPGVVKRAAEYILHSLNCDEECRRIDREGTFT
ncbi:hypothetical protein M758_9G064700 [Ceratodon purpureus]|nr:hypothetical protein M758_9G064700 [Ceratodon purpureus]